MCVVLRGTLSNAHWKLIYTSSVTSNAFIGLLVSRDICIVSLKWLFTYDTLNVTIYITLHYIINACIRTAILDFLVKCQSKE